MAFRSVSRERRFVVAGVVVLAGILLRTYLALVPYINQPIRNLDKNIDWAYINSGLDETDNLADTGKWWTGAWVGTVPFWRPLTSYAFWGMRSLWPKEHLLPRQIVLAFLHLAFTGMAGLLLWRLTKRPWLVLLTLGLFAGLRPSTMAQPQVFVMPVDDILLDPKNLPDVLAGIAVLAALLLLLNRKWAPALMMAVAGVCFKEIGFTAWPMAVLMLAWVNRDRLGRSSIAAALKRNWFPISMWVLAMIGLLIIHFLAVGYGFTEGSNRCWPARIIMFFGWPLLANLILYERTAAILACLLFAAFVLLRRGTLIVRFAGLLAALWLGIALDALIYRTTLDVSAARILLLGNGLGIMALCLAWLTVVWGARADWRMICFALAMAFIAAGPSWAAAQTWAHTRYLAALFMETAVAAVICRNALLVARAWRNKKVLNVYSASERVGETSR